ncbi:unannotated protein [freshwater metagenome]|uniref:Unannotated protein n=1 Tax=freshwater metagenome TaxID=449393 RepID=A0A6J6MLM8_9ZZZZ|nr:hypothetical protein [Actinomycetota bacterium]
MTKRVVAADVVGAVGAAADPKIQSQAQMRVSILLIAKVKPAMSQMTMRIRRIRELRAAAVAVAVAVNLMSNHPRMIRPTPLSKCVLHARARKKMTLVPCVAQRD